MRSFIEVVLVVAATGCSGNQEFPDVAQSGDDAVSIVPDVAVAETDVDTDISSDASADVPITHDVASADAHGVRDVSTTDVTTDVPPIFPDINASYPAAGLQVAYLDTYLDERSQVAGYALDHFSNFEMGMTSGCSFLTDRVAFAAWACDARHVNCNELIGSIPVGSGVATMTLRYDSAVPPDLIQVERGAVLGTSGHQRESFHVQFRRAASTQQNGASGIAGETVDPTLGDVWLLGCPLQ